MTRFLRSSGQLVDLSAAQDVEAGDGTTSVVVLAGSLLGAAEKMLQKGIHPTIVAEAFLKASVKAVQYLSELSVPVDLTDKTSLLRAASTSLNSKVSACQVGRLKTNLESPKDRLPVFLHSCSNRRFCCYAACDPRVVQCRSTRHSSSEESRWYH